MPIPVAFQRERELAPALLQPFNLLQSLMNASIKVTAGVLSGSMESFWKEEGQKEVAPLDQQIHFSFR